MLDHGLSGNLDASPFDLAKLLDPILPATFFAEYWEQKPLFVSRTNPGYYAPLLKVEQIDPLLTALAPQDITLVNADAPLEVEEMARKNTGSAPLEVVRACQLFLEGATIIFGAVHERLATFAAICRHLEIAFSAPLQANLYMTPACGSGLKTHYDTHDTILIQLGGSKEWAIFDPPMSLPLVGQKFDETIHKIGEPIMSVVLSAGDLLYIPRGFPHRGRARDDTSVHVTLGVLTYRWSEVLIESMAQICLTDPAFRRALPTAFSRSDFDIAAARREFSDLMQRAAGLARLDPVLGRIADEFVTRRRAFVPGQLDQAALAQNLAVGDEVGVRSTALFRMCNEGPAVRILSQGREITMPAEAAEAVAFALRSSRYRVRDLPGDLSDDDKLAIVSHLIEEGLVLRYSAGERCTE
ncbi:MAG: cupin domain-containing protein [Methylovirgula sp.]